MVFDDFRAFQLTSCLIHKDKWPNLKPNIDGLYLTNSEVLALK